MRVRWSRISGFKVQWPKPNRDKSWMAKNGLYPWIKHDKSLPVIELMDTIRQKIMEKLYQRRTLAMKLTSKVLPHIIKSLNAKSRGLVGYSIHKGLGHMAEISGV